MSSSSGNSKGRKAGGKKSASSHGRASHTDLSSIADVNGMDEHDLKSLLDCVSRCEKPDSGPEAKGMATAMLKKERAKIDKEERAFPGQIKPLKTVNGNHTNDLLSARSVAVIGDGDVKGPAKASTMVNSSLSLGSAGSSKASSNASDESEEADNSAASNASGEHDYGCYPTMAVLNIQDENDDGKYDMRSFMADNLNHPPHVLAIYPSVRSCADALNYGTEIDLSNGSENTRRMSGKDTGSDRESGALGFSTQQTLSVPKGGSQSDPSPDNNHEYLKKKAGRKRRLQKLTKFDKKKPDVVLGSSLDSQNDFYNRAFQKAADGEASDFLDRLCFNLHEQKASVADVSRNSNEAENYFNSASNAGKGKKAHSRSKSKKDHTSIDTSIPYRPLNNKKTDQSDSEEVESFHGSDPESVPDAAVCDIVNQSKEVFFQAEPVMDFMADSLDYNVDCDVEMTPLEDMMAVDSIDIGCPAENQMQLPEIPPSEKMVVCRTSSNSSRSSVDKMEIDHGSMPLDGYTQDADIDELDKLDPSLAGGSAQAKKKKRKIKKKKSKGKSQSVTSKDSSVSSFLVNERERGVDVAPDVPVVVPATKPMTPECVSDHHSDTEFQVVGPRRYAQKTSPAAKSQASYPGAYKYNGTAASNRTRSSASQSKTPSKQSASVSVPPAASEYQLRRRNSAGDIKKVGLEPTPVGMEAAGDSSDRDSVRSMPVKNSKNGTGKTTSAPATRLPTPGISYADIAKGAHNGYAQAVSTEAVAPQSASISQGDVVQPPKVSDIEHEEKGLEADGRGIADSENNNPDLVTSVDTTPTPCGNDADCPVEQPLEEHTTPTTVIECPPVETQYHSEEVTLERVIQSAPTEPINRATSNSSQKSSTFGQPYYPDFGETTNVHTYETHAALLRTMKPSQPLAPRTGPQIYHRPDLKLPFREKSYGRYHDRGRHYGNRGNGPRGYYPTAHYSHVVPLEHGRKLEAEKDCGTAQNERPRESGDSKVTLEQQTAVQKEESTMQNGSTLAEALDFFESEFGKIREKCLKGAPGYLYFKP
ncbi:uncharacterized protein LOC129581998 isoform X2 [Paramacrobiotus metropolitanus]|uniref:uncharacterized protein LOC129581998 isoform X2 n=1 Tax=Paramacrobiotus metropolitanus TaxID=2943436 RepID=UPI0024461FE4|nr:uncharacterized protein LOC129581998 isoform X2 [Paramacrobiotus metropolitanus]